ncbi:MAG TPA: hypothetical protein VN457_04670 [Chlamydiales bacterium]|nr:hypothetical protein [Chlamydiales bacterium]
MITIIANHQTAKAESCLDTQPYKHAPAHKYRVLSDGTLKINIIGVRRNGAYTLPIQVDVDGKKVSLDKQHLTQFAKAFKAAGALASTVREILDLATEYSPATKLGVKVTVNGQVSVNDKDIPLYKSENKDSTGLFAKAIKAAVDFARAKALPADSKAEKQPPAANTEVTK